MENNSKNVYVYYAYNDFENETPLSKKFEADDKIIIGEAYAFVIVKEEHKRYFEDKYNLPLTEFRIWYKENGMNFLSVADCVYDEKSKQTEIGRLLKLAFNDSTYTEVNEKMFIRKMLMRLYAQKEQKIIDDIVHGTYDDMLSEIVRNGMIKYTITYLKDSIKMLKEV